MVSFALGWFVLVAAGVILLIVGLIVWITVGIRWLRLHPGTDASRSDPAPPTP
jgi:hypothetical protein